MKKTAFMIDFLGAVAAGPGQYRRARKQLRATGEEYVEIISKAGNLVGGVSIYPHFGGHGWKQVQVKK